MVTLRQMKINKSFVFFFFLVMIFVITTSIQFKKMEASILEICKSNAHSIALKCTEDAISENIKGVTYSNIINIEKTKDGKIVAITSNVNELNKLSNNIITSIEENLEKRKNNKISIPIGTFFGSKTFGGYGFNIKIKTLPVGDVDIEYISHFDNVGINQTRHRIILKIKSKVKIIAPLNTVYEEYLKEVVVAETVLIGDIPNSYYNISGIDNLETKDIISVGE